MDLVPSANNISTVDTKWKRLKFKKLTTTTLPAAPVTSKITETPAMPVISKKTETPIKKPGKNNLLIKKNTSPFVRQPQAWIYPQNNNPYQLYHPYHRLTVYRNKK